MRLLAGVPPDIHDLMVTGINVPVRIGNATVMPDDVVFGVEGVYVIPPSQTQSLVDEAEVTHIQDDGTKQKFMRPNTSPPTSTAAGEIRSCSKNPNLKEKLGA